MNSMLIGLHAGADLTGGDQIVIIGDGIRDLEAHQPGRIYVDPKCIVGPTVMGHPCALFEHLLAAGFKVRS